MEPESTTYRTVKLELKKPWYINYLRWVFDSDTDTIKINRSENLGRYLFSFVRNSSLPVHFDKTKPHVTLIMPDHKNSTGKNKFMYYNEEDMVYINDQIESCARFDLSNMINASRRDLGMNRKTVVSIFTTLIFGEDSYEALIKSEYRNRKKKVLRTLESGKLLGYR